MTPQNQNEKDPAATPYETASMRSSGQQRSVLVPDHIANAKPSNSKKAKRTTAPVSVTVSFVYRDPAKYDARGTRI
jgi:hypothetical protein